MANTQNMSPEDVLRDSISSAVANVVRSVEPQLHEYASQLTEQALDQGKKLVTTTFRTVRREPWYLVGVAAVLLVGAAIILGISAPHETEIEGVSPNASV